MSSEQNHTQDQDTVEHFLKVAYFDPASCLPPSAKPESASQTRATTSPASSRSKVRAASSTHHSRAHSSPNSRRQKRSGKSFGVLESIRSKVSRSRRSSNTQTLAQQQEALRRPPLELFAYDYEKAELIVSDVHDWKALQAQQNQKAAEETEQQNGERQFFKAATRRSRVPRILDARNSRTISVYGLPGVDGNRVGSYRRVQLKNDSEESDRAPAVPPRPSRERVPDEEQRALPPIPSKSELRQASSPFAGPAQPPPPTQPPTTHRRSLTMTSLNTEPKETSRDLAKQQQKVIHERLRRKGAPVPPYDFIELIGKGTYGRVYSAIDKKDGNLVAVKVMEADSTDYNDLQHHQRDMTLRDFRAEIGFLLALKEVHAPNINHIIDVFDVHDQLWIITEYCAGGSVRTLMQAADDKHLQEPYVIAITREMVKGLKAIHEAQIIHRDIKASNLMVTETGEVQIIDFGVASNLESHFDKRKTIIGTLHWMAPEMLKSVKDESLRVEYNKEIDIWSAGCTIYEMVTGLPPYARANGRNMAQMARQPPRLLASDEVSQNLCDFLEFVLQSKPENRPTASQMLAHPYLAGTEITQPTSILVDLVTGFKQWTTKGNSRHSLFNPEGAVVAALVPEASDTDSTHWRFSELPSAEELAKFHSQMNTITEVTTPTTSHLPQNQRQQTLSPAEGNYHLKPTIYTPNSVQSTFVFPNQASPDVLRSPSSLSAHQGVMSSPEKQGREPEDTFVTGNEEFEEAAEKGGKMLGNIFRQSGVYEYGRKPSPPPSDLPLRTTTTNSNVHSKEVVAPDPSRPRLLAPGSVPDIGSVDVNTIKQNRQASRSGSATNSGDEAKDIMSKPKRDTMAWEPDWNFSETPAAEPDHPDPFASFDRDFASTAAVASGSSGLAPPVRPGLHQVNSAPGVIPTVADSRASVGSSLDLDALMGEDFAMPVFPGQGQSSALSDPTYSPAGLDSGKPLSDPLYPTAAQELTFPSHTDYPPFENGQYPGSPDDLDSPIPLPLNITPPRRNTGGAGQAALPPFSDRPLGPIPPPNPLFLAGRGDSELAKHELEYYLEGTMAELGALDQDIQAMMAREDIENALARANGDYDDDDYGDEEGHEEAYEGECEGEHDAEGDH